MENSHHQRGFAAQDYFRIEMFEQNEIELSPPLSPSSPAFESRLVPSPSKANKGVYTPVFTLGFHLLLDQTDYAAGIQRHCIKQIMHIFKGGGFSFAQLAEN